MAWLKPDTHGAQVMSKRACHMKTPESSVANRAKGGGGGGGRGARILTRILHGIGKEKQVIWERLGPRHQ